MLPLPGPVPPMLARLLRVWWSSMRGNAHILQLAKGQEESMPESQARRETSPGFL